MDIVGNYNSDFWWYFYQTLGWVGNVLFIISYIQLNRGVWTLKTKKYHTYNIWGGILLVANTLYDYSIAAAMSNVFWVGIAVYGWYKYREKKTDTSFVSELS